MSPREDEAQFLDALLGADPDESPRPRSRAGAAAARTAEPRSRAPRDVEAHQVPSVDLQPKREPERQPERQLAAAAAGPSTTARRSYEPVLPVPDDPEVVKQLHERAGVSTEKPRLAGFLEGLLGIVTPESEEDARKRLIEAYGETASEASGEGVDQELEAAVPTTDVPVVEAPVDEPQVPATEADEAVEAPSVEEPAEEEHALPPLAHDVVAEEGAPPPLSHDVVAEEDRAAALVEPEVRPDESAPAHQPAAAAAGEPVEAPEPETAEPVQPVPAAAEADAPPAHDEAAELVRSLTSFDVGRRRRALVALLERPLDRELATAAASSLRDPESGIRMLAVQVLERAPELAPVEALDLAMLDPDAEIRRRAAALIGRTGDLQLLAHLQERLEDETDEDVLAAGLTAVADLFRVAGERAADGDLDRVSATVGHLRTAALPQLGRELTILARTLDAGEIRHRLGDVAEPVRVGAAVLALEEGSDDSLRALARLVTDESARVRQLAMSAVARLRGGGGDGDLPPRPAPSETRRDAAPDEPRHGMSRAVADEVQGALLPGLLDALADPKQEIRDQARNALALVDRSRLAAYVEEQATQAGPDELVKLITVTQRLSLDEIVPALASAALRHDSPRSAAQLGEALRDLPAAVELLEQWRSADDPEARGDAVRLAVLLGDEASTAVLAGLGDPNPNVRLTAIETAVGRIDDQLADALLGIIERDPSTRVQIAALDAFRDAPTFERTAAARAASASPVADVRRHALSILSPESSEDFSQLAAALRDSDPGVVEAAARILSSSGAPEATALLWSEIRTSTGDIRHLMLDVLHAEQPRVLSRLAQRAVESMDPAERAAGLSALALLGDTGVRDQILAALGDPSVDVRQEALRALAAEPGTVGTAPLVAVMRDADPGVRALAVDVIAGTEDEDALPLLVRALDDPAEAVRLATRRALGRVRSPAAVDLLLEALERPAHQAAAIEALASLGETATGRLVRAFASSSGDIREAIREALLRSGAIERTVKTLGDPRPARRRAALTLLRAVRPEGIAPNVAERLEDPDPEVRQAAAQLLGELGDRSAVPALQHAFVNDPDMDVVAAVETAYRRLGGGEVR